MLSQSKNIEKTIRIASNVTLIFMVCYGLVLVLAQVKPFWVDEWRVIYNLKYKSPAMLFGQLDFMQQFPRVYLVIIKSFTALFDYSYFTLRLPSYLVGTCTILFSYQLMKKIFHAANLNRFLFVMILVSSYTFTEYFVQVKQYTMDMLLSLVSIWQFIELLKTEGRYPGHKRYLLLCASFLFLPFFSYTYPIAIAPVFIIFFIKGVLLLRQKSDKNGLMRLWLPIFLGCISIGLFYVIDVSQLMADRQMQQFWKTIMMKDGFTWRSFFVNFFFLFAAVGSGLFYNILFGLLGIGSFLYGIYKCSHFLKRKCNILEWSILYSVLLIALVILLFISGKLPVGEPRLNAFTIPAISILIIYLLSQIHNRLMISRLSRYVAYILYIGVTGNIYTSFYNAVSGPEYAKRMGIYESTENAIILAQGKKLPIFITPGVAYPYEYTKNLPFDNTVPGDWVLKTFPAYKVDEHMPVYALNNLGELTKRMKNLPPHIRSVMAGDGASFKLVDRLD